MAQLIKNQIHYFFKCKHCLNCGISCKSLRSDFSEKFLLGLQMLIPSYFPTLTSYANYHVKIAFVECISSGMKHY